MSAVTTSAVTTTRTRRRFGAYGAVVAQLSQAVGSFLLHVLAKHFLGLEGLAEYALLFGVIVVGTAVMTGLVGDSLTVLDRSDPSIRAGLQAWLVAVSVGVGASFAAGAQLTGRFSLLQSALFGAAGALFVAEDTLRRVLMASLRFWSLVIVDLSALCASIGCVVAVSIVGDVTITTFLIGLSIGQVVASIVAVGLLPYAERTWARGARRAWRAVWAYGAWRALQQILRPSMMTVVRLAITTIVSLTAFGTLEVARLYIAPAMLMVSGGASYLFASYARDRSGDFSRLRRRADRAVLTMVGVTAMAGAVAILLVPQFGALIAGDDTNVGRGAVAGWVVYTAATAAVTPYGSLAAVGGQQIGVFLVRVGESIGSIALVLVMLLAGASPTSIPYALAVIAALSGVAMRVWLLNAASANQRHDDPGDDSRHTGGSPVPPPPTLLPPPLVWPPPPIAGS